MFKVGSRVSVYPLCPELGGKYYYLPRDCTGTIVKLPDSYYRVKNPNVPVRIDGFHNSKSTDGSYWFKLSSLLPFVSGPEEAYIPLNDFDKNESEENTMLNAPVIKEKFCPVTCTVYVPDSPRTIQERFALYPDLYDSISVGDTVVIHCDNYGEALAEVREIDEMGTFPPYSYGREVVCKVDFTSFKERSSLRKKTQDLFHQMQEVAQNISFLSLFESMAEKSPEMKNLLDEYKSITSGGEE